MIDLQTLIIFLVFEKQVLSMEDNVKELDLYFLEKHSQRMNKELHAYKKKMNISYGKKVFKVWHENWISYIFAYSLEQAKFIAYQNLVEIESIKECELDKLMDYKGKYITLETLIKNKQPCLLGSFEITNYPSLGCDAN